MTYIERAATMNDDEWRFVVGLLAREYDVNENEMALALLKKISGVSTDGGDKALTSAVRFFEFDERTRKIGKESAVGKAMTTAGFDVEHTGGGIYLWHKPVGQNHYIYLSGADDDLGDTIDEAFGLGVYDNDSNQVGWYQATNLADALAHVAQCEFDVASFVKKHPFN